MYVCLFEFVLKVLDYLEVLSVQIRNRLLY